VGSISVNVVVPALLRKLADGQEQVKITLNNDIMFDVRGCVDTLAAQYPGVKQKLYNKQGEIPRFVYFFVNRRRVDEDQPVSDGDELLIMIAVSGG
jgi:molybdopterin converting factor small subunit